MGQLWVGVLDVWTMRHPLYNEPNHVWSARAWIQIMWILWNLCACESNRFRYWKAATNNNNNKKQHCKHFKYFLTLTTYTLTGDTKSIRANDSSVIYTNTCICEMKCSSTYMCVCLDIKCITHVSYLKPIDLILPVTPPPPPTKPCSWAKLKVYPSPIRFTFIEIIYKHTHTHTYIYTYICIREHY